MWLQQNLPAVMASSFPLTASNFIVGNLYRIKTSFGISDGKVVTVDAVNEIVVLEYLFERKSNFIFIALQSIVSFENLPEYALETSPSVVLNDKIEVITARLEKSVSIREELASKIGKNVSLLAQNIFDALSIMPCHWDKDTIVVMDAVRVVKPYFPENCLGANPSQLTRVQNIVAVQRKKLKL